MTSAGLALRAAIHAKLTADAGVIAALGGARVYDDVPNQSAFPYLVFADATARDWSTASDTGHEHFVTLHAWSRASGRKETDVIMAAVHTAVHDQPLALAGHRLINLRHDFSDARRGGDGESYQGVIRFRAVTEAV